MWRKREAVEIYNGYRHSGGLHRLLLLNFLRGTERRREMDDSEMFAATFANLALIISVLSLCVAVAQLFLGLGCIEQFFIGFSPCR